MTRPLSSHDAIERLIPWYANGTLDEVEMDTVNRHLADCPSCRRSVQAEIAFSQALREPPLELRQLPTAGAAWTEFSTRLTGRRHPRRQASAGLLAALALAIAGASFLVGEQVRPPAFETLTSPVAHDGPVIQIMFEPSTPEGVIRQVLRDAGGTVIAGPTARGVYRVGLPDGSDGRARETELRDSRAVRWVALEAR